VVAAVNVTAATLVLPGLDAPALWQRRTRADRAARALADRHYSRGTVGAHTIGPPGRVLVFVTPCERAAWITHYPRADLAMDNRDAWRCTMFRNEGAGLSSDLIRAAMAATVELWGDPPVDGWLTYVDRARVRGVNPGYCFKMAGWTLEREWRSRWAPSLVRLRA
jgi:hypothetical protein